ncbi:hypothetical protein PInf_022830 [Phytophthora infestans]|nr:hypothetical protein PInf_022830 [Phytophthora infestans]
MADLETDQELSMKTKSIDGFVRDVNVGERDDESLECMESLSQPEDDEADRVKPSKAELQRCEGKDEYQVDDHSAVKSVAKILPTRQNESKPSSFEVLRLPPPNARTKKKTKQGWITKQPKFAAVLVATDVTTTLTQIIQWANYCPKVEKVSNVLDQYPVRLTDKFIQARMATCEVAKVAIDSKSMDHAFVIPVALLKMAEAVMVQEREILVQDDEAAS